MSVKIDGMAEISANIAKLTKQKLPQAAKKSLNTLARRAMKGATQTVAKEIGVPHKTIRNRAKLTKPAEKTRLEARIKVIRSNMPAIRLFENRSTKMWVGRGGIVVGKYAIKRGFKQTLKNGRTHLMQRQGKARYSIDVVKIPLSQPLTQAFSHELKDYQQDIQKELTKQLSEVFK
ncbi:phage tail protein [Actinobacillus pleuropneumoniae]|uniref:Phage tail protein n=5 Tax=Actinobacillus pleuropneumoniae TaxID=715 RepID=A0A9Q4H4W7_ACTPL|nr:phage tail protein [Actinobacillus pleuropneumoniae]ABN73617.1 putative phage tail component [Actinobacillus pleuropneumoniae serovar 5b str. L20]ACE61146.1 putative phage tail component [Actinobacillus pleuropneumoniae serovar 7 str. AP76]ASU16483.1 hypothetical protein CHY23_01739 [Actinobacillus pleuropneumoniae]AWG94939.1 phage tail protein [Actinobacillus pleuropneumoniae serovar 1 str. 4074]AXA21011.1 phage tail protein [Actinobacillus pleuropneumoniae]